MSESKERIKSLDRLDILDELIRINQSDVLLFSHQIIDFRINLFLGGSRSTPKAQSCHFNKLCTSLNRKYK